MLKDHANADLENFSGGQYVPGDADMFCRFSDAMPHQLHFVFETVITR